jgi:hypothetical protein
MEEDGFYHATRKTEELSKELAGLMLNGVGPGKLMNDAACKNRSEHSSFSVSHRANFLIFSALHSDAEE